jgi:hypothetical protein
MIFELDLSICFDFVCGGPDEDPPDRRAPRDRQMQLAYSSSTQLSGAGPTSPTAFSTSYVPMLFRGTANHLPVYVRFATLHSLV